MAPRKPLATYTTLAPVRLHGEDIPVGEDIEIDEQTALQLIEAKVIDPDSGAPSQAKPGSANTGPSDPEQRLAAIVEAVGELDPKNEDLWLRDGKPDAAALSSALGWTVKAAERDAAWQAINESK